MGLKSNNASPEVRTGNKGLTEGNEEGEGDAVETVLAAERRLSARRCRRSIEASLQTRAELGDEHVALAKNFTELALHFDEPRGVGQRLFHAALCG